MCAKVRHSGLWSAPPCVCGSVHLTSYPAFQEGSPGPVNSQHPRCVLVCRHSIAAKSVGNCADPARWPSCGGGCSCDILSSAPEKLGRRTGIPQPCHTHPCGASGPPPAPTLPPGPASCHPFFSDPPSSLTGGGRPWQESCCEMTRLGRMARTTHGCLMAATPTSSTYPCLSLLPTLGLMWGGRWGEGAPHSSSPVGEQHNRHGPAPTLTGPE